VSPRCKSPKCGWEVATETIQPCPGTGAKTVTIILCPNCDRRKCPSCSTPEMTGMSGNACRTCGRRVTY